MVKNLAKKSIELYFNTEITPHNNTNNTKQYKQHITTPKNKENVSLCGVCVITLLWKNKEKDNIQNKVSNLSKENSFIFYINSIYLSFIFMDKNKHFNKV